jgi:hypothetical protein
MRKGQAALEFLTTYGWAFLVILVMIGALAYFGVLNPSGLLPARCTFSPEISCLEHKVNSNLVANPMDNSLEFRFRNNVGQMADFTFNATELSSDISGTCVCDGVATCTIKAGRTAAVNCTDFTGVIFASGDKIKFEVNANFTKSGGLYSTPVKGEIYGEAQP